MFLNISSDAVLLILSYLFFTTIIFIANKKGVKGFWNDQNGWELAEAVVIATLPTWTYVAIKFALTKDLSINQVNYFSILSYPLLIAVGGKAITTIPQIFQRNQIQNQYPIQNQYYSQQNNMNDQKI